jgi:hypothetical protein
MSTQTIQVLVRARPNGNDGDADEDREPSGIRIDPAASAVSFTRDRKGQSDFQFTKVYDQIADQRSIYSTCDVIGDVVEGINCCIMAYGQTGSGKTYTMYGLGWEDGVSALESSMKLNKSMELRQGEGIARADADDISVGDNLEESSVMMASDEELGVIPRAITDLFRVLEEKAAANTKFDYSISKEACRLHILMRADRNACLFRLPSDANLQ